MARAQKRQTVEDKQKEDGVTSASVSVHPATDDPSTQKRKNIVWRYSKELWSDHRFWKQMFLLKGGMGVVTTGLLLVPVIMSLPAIMLASAVVLGGVLAVGAAFSIAVGASGLVGTFSRARKKINAEFGRNKDDITGVPKDQIALSQTRMAFKDMLTEKWPMRPIVNSKLVKRINQSRAVNRFKSFMNESDNLLDTLTVKNSALTVAIFGGMLLAVELVAAPIFFSVAFLAYTVASLGFAMYMGYEGLKDMGKRREEAKRLKKLAQEKANSPASKLARAKNNVVESFKSGGAKLKKGWISAQFWKKADKEQNAAEEKPAKKPAKKPANENTAAPAAQKNSSGKSRWKLL
ncbi:MAG: hypothetical protein EP349_04990 [Alphaproteobacteria bacterium]|nr:MAG: hypothetical protein EP349_04990 [Alphaproteobacteria bacterium]